MTACAQVTAALGPRPRNRWSVLRMPSTSGETESARQGPLRGDSRQEPRRRGDEGNGRRDLAGRSVRRRAALEPCDLDVTRQSTAHIALSDPPNG